MPVPKHPAEMGRRFASRNARESKTIEDFKLANPGLPVRHEHIALDAAEKPYPCVWPGCLIEVLDSSALCAEHELVFMAIAGHRSPRIENLIDWNDALHDRTAWLIPIWERSRK